jgi:hypothetical protein
VNLSPLGDAPTLLAREFAAQLDALTLCWARHGLPEDSAAEALQQVTALHAVASAALLSAEEDARGSDEVLREWGAPSWRAAHGVVCRLQTAVAAPGRRW